MKFCFRFLIRRFVGIALIAAGVPLSRLVVTLIAKFHSPLFTVNFLFKFHSKMFSGRYSADAKTNSLRNTWVLWCLSILRNFLYTKCCFSCFVFDRYASIDSLRLAIRALLERRISDKIAAPNSLLC